MVLVFNSSIISVYSDGAKQIVVLETKVIIKSAERSNNKTFGPNNVST